MMLLSRERGGHGFWIEAEVARIAAHVAPGVHGSREAVQVAGFDRHEVCGPKARRGRRLGDAEAAFDAGCLENGSEVGVGRPRPRLPTHSRPKRSRSSSTSGRFIKTSRDFDPWYPPMTRWSASWSTMRPARE